MTKLMDKRSPAEWLTILGMEPQIIEQYTLKEKRVQPQASSSSKRAKLDDGKHKAYYNIITY